MSFQKAFAWSIFWIGISLIVGLVLALLYGSEVATQFYTGYAIEKALSIDNLFVFLMLFTYFKVRPADQRRILNYGIIGVLVLRGLLIFAGIALINRFEWLMYLFGAIVIYTGFVMALEKEESNSPEESRIIRIARKFLPVAEGNHGKHFFILQNGRRKATTLLLVLVVVEVTDLIFAVDSIPAILSVSRNPLIVFSSNMLAVLGLRSLYFLLERMQNAFRFVKKGVGIILWFVGVKMIAPLFWPHFALSNLISLSIILSVLVLSVLLSAVVKRRRPSHP